ncbi:DEAD/DEAH box helicase [Paenibacillus radicis (ex Gao et al. 2016)]|uniref:Helicase SNF n=1 Tax=Paenibacillus radicis (ex Gao et al. 2016) TaxID=1737354 RepID=A0A917H7W8_9BACL|nr:DEAD/DEAH box helicase [Paenibacillus radicis (ex Gao et al. 2016)]GGG70880.1 helicase SNF [Paenibacillus radicis (ex Gao et al. 2016)]
MSFIVSKRVIKLLCGNEAYNEGEHFASQHKVAMIMSDPDSHHYKAEVAGGGSRYRVNAEIDTNGDVHATCNCPPFYSRSTYCKHIAALLIHLHNEAEKSFVPVRAFPSLLHPEPQEDRSAALTARYTDEEQAADSIIQLFENKRLPASGAGRLFDTRTPLEVEFAVQTVPYGNRRHVLGIELKVGPKRLYIVQQMQDFLKRLEQRQPYIFTKSFVYDPEQHCFRPEQDAILQLLIQITKQDQLLRGSSMTTRKSTSGNDRMLLIPPLWWNAALPLFTSSPGVLLVHDYGIADGIRVSDKALPVKFQFDQSERQSDSGGYQLTADGLEQLTVLGDYGAVIGADGELFQLPPEQLARLSELQLMLESAFKGQVQIAAPLIEPFMEKVVPGLMKLGSVHIAEPVAEKIVHTPLKAKLFLDRVKDRLLAALEFHYGEIVINPLEADSGRSRSTDRILMRDGEQERRILELMDGSGFLKTESGYVTAEEETEYHFLYHIVPQLEKLLRVYATTAVKIRLHTGSIPPKISVRSDERMHWLQFTFSIDGIPESEIREVIQSVEEKRRYYRLPSGALMPLEQEQLLAMIRVLNEVGIRSGDLDGNGVRLPIVRGLPLIDADTSAGGVVKLDKNLRELLEHLRNPDHFEFELPDGLNATLREYQKFGFQWMKTLAHYRFGGILADDMGLGKTVQSIAYLLSVIPHIREEKKPALIVCPASLVYNWRNELERFAPEINVIVADGTKAERFAFIDNASDGAADIFITSYPLLRMDIERYARQKFHTLIVDEAQFFKNHLTQTAQAVKLLNADYRFALSGTPVENRLEELWSIFEAVFPALLPDRKTFNDMSPELIAKRIRPFLLRRRKADVLKELPEKIETQQVSELLPDQKRLYAAYLAKLKQDTLKHLNDKTFERNKIKILAGLTRLRQLCLHPALFVEDYAGGSAKLEQLLELIEECRASGRRLLIFSQFTGMLSIIGRELSSTGMPFFYLDGQTPAADRVELCNRFNEGERDLFLISLKAGGTGLNLTGADTVILYDLWWNPAVEQQAADRAHRMGQKNVVQVVRLISQGTVEQKMYELQQKKLNLLDNLVQPGEEALSALSEQDIRELLQIGV